MRAKVGGDEVTIAVSSEEARMEDVLALAAEHGVELTRALDRC